VTSLSGVPPRAFCITYTTPVQTQGDPYVGKESFKINIDGTILGGFKKYPSVPCNHALHVLIIYHAIVEEYLKGVLLNKEHIRYQYSFHKE
jgi:hypothetical protein